jgi:membrane protease YdiL (CAAX protease family)
MADKATLLSFNELPPFYQLLISFVVILAAGTLMLLLFILAGSVIFGTGIEEMLVLPEENADSVSLLRLKYVQASQHIAFFILPGGFLLYAMGITRKGASERSLPDLNSLFLVVLLALFVIPVTSYTGVLNSEMNLPEWLSPAEEWMKQQEENASLVTGLLIEADNLSIMIINLFVLAVLPAVGEEMIFRGVIQKILCRYFINGNIAVWLTALLFSAVHFQFYGFIPRFILGLIFGYLFYWSGTLWLPVIAHFVNNAVSVAGSWAEGWETLNEQSKLLAEQPLIVPLIPALITLLLLFYFRSKRLTQTQSRVDEC